jgi:hypothetical protein
MPGAARVIGLDDLAQPGEECVALAQMADAAAVPVAERLVRIARGRITVTLQQGDWPARRAQRQRRA